MIELRTLGTLELRDTADGRALNSVLAQPKRAAFLAYLALAGPGRFHRRDTLLGVFWPESPEKQARHSLSQAVYLLRRSLGAEAIVVRGEEELSLSPEHVRCDAVEFDRLIAAGHPADALDLYHGELLQGFHLGDSGEFEKWLSAERLRLQVAAVGATRRLLEEADASGDAAAAIRWLRRGVEWAPYDEALRRELMARLARGGDRSGALLEYDALARRLRRDLEVEPAEETHALARALRDGDGQAGRDGSPVPARAATADARATPAKRAPMRAAWRRAALFAPLLLLAGAAPLLVRRDAASAGMPRAGTDNRVAVLPFDVRGSERLAYLGEGMALLLSAKLDGAGTLRGVDPEAVLNFVDAHDADGAELGRAVARRFDAGQYVRGTVVEAGGRFSVRVGLYDRDGELRTQASGDALDEAGIFAVVDDLARTLIASRFGARADRLSREAAQTTQSLPALKAYLEGERAFRRGRFAEAAAAFERAALRDSTFALAHYRLSLSSLWADAPDTLPFDAEERALRHAARLSEHDHQLLLAYAAWRRGDATEAERRYRNVLALYPDDVEAALMLGETLFHYNPLRGRSLVEARAPLEHVVELDGGNWGALWHLLLIAGTERRRADFDALAARLEQLGPSGQQALELRTLRAFAAKDEAAIAALLPALRAAHPLQAGDIAWRIAVHLHDPAGAMRVARLGTASDRNPWFREYAYLHLAWLELAQGRDRAAARQLDAIGALGAPIERETARALALGLPFRRRDEAAIRAQRAAMDAQHPGDAGAVRSYPYGLLELAAGDTAAALRHAATLDALGEAAAPFAVGLRAGVHLAAGRADSVVALLDRNPLVRWFGWASSTPAQSGTPTRWIHAEALRRLGRGDEALGWYASFAEGAIHDLAWLAPAHLRSAEIHEAAGRREQAALHYRRAIELWQGADPELQPAVARARDRLRALEAGR